MSQRPRKEEKLDQSSPDVSGILPCLDEAETLAFCIHEIRETARAAGLQCEIIVSDNGSSDRSIKIAKSLEVTIIHASPKGYGVALRAGIDAANAPFVMTADADGSCDFGDIPKFLEKLRNGNDLVIGNRFAGDIQPGAMPWSHRWIGNPGGFAGGMVIASSKCFSVDGNDLAVSDLIQLSHPREQDRLEFFRFDRGEDCVKAIMRRDTRSHVQKSCEPFFLGISKLGNCHKVIRPRDHSEDHYEQHID